MMKYFKLLIILLLIGSFNNASFANVTVGVEKHPLTCNPPNNPGANVTAVFADGDWAYWPSASDGNSEVPYGKTKNFNVNAFPGKTIRAFGALSGLVHWMPDRPLHPNVNNEVCCFYKKEWVFKWVILPAGCRPGKCSNPC